MFQRTPSGLRPSTVGNIQFSENTAFHDFEICNQNLIMTWQHAGNRLKVGIVDLYLQKFISKKFTTPTFHRFNPYLPPIYCLRLHSTAFEKIYRDYSTP